MFVSGYWDLSPDLIDHSIARTLTIRAYVKFKSSKIIRLPSAVNPTLIAYRFVECMYQNRISMDVCASCGAFRHSLAAEIGARTAALLQTCDRSNTTLRQLLARFNAENVRGQNGIRISELQLQEELDWQLSQHSQLQASGTVHV